MQKNSIKYILFTLLLLFSIRLQSQIIQVRLFNNFQIKTFSISPEEGKFYIFANKSKVSKIKKNHLFYVSIVGNKISLWNNEDLVGTYDTIRIVSMEKEDVLKIEAGNPALPIRYYQGDFLISTTNNNLQIDNFVQIEDYLSGVVEAEAGYNAPFEYYKVQAIISRTYLYNIIHSPSYNEKKQEKYFIGDDVSFQVYKGMNRINPYIKQAVLHTRGLVIIDTTFRFITAVFHSNSGGTTANSEDVWLSSRTYLKQTTDPFSLKQSHSFWTDTLYVKDWLSYFKNLGIDTENIANRKKITNISQQERTKYLYINEDSLLLTKVRQHFKFKSSWFSTHQEGDKIIIKGRGYGHGVGLSQQGAMQMAMENHSFLEIIYFYYKNVKVVHINTVFF